MDVLDEIVARLPGSRRLGLDAARPLIVAVGADEAALDVEPRLSLSYDIAPCLRLRAAVAPLDGLELEVSPSERRLRVDGDGLDAPLRVRLDDGAHVALTEARRGLGVADLVAASNDGTLAQALLDDVARAALVDALELRIQLGLWGRRAVVGGGRLRVADGEVGFEWEGGVDLDRLAPAAFAVAAIATAPDRLTRRCARVAEALDGHLTGDRWQLGDGFAIRVVRGGVPMELDHVRTLAHEPASAARLRTRLRAPRDWGGDGAAAGRAAAAVKAAGLARVPTLWTSPDHLTLLWDGLIDDTAELVPALDLMRRLATPGAAPVGPYR
ncbi:MAG: hypothetical protein H6709_10925 [Kofleriaceae bacterium]|nr:hypothetical protein [Kofleriaceae bacterium]